MPNRTFNGLTIFTEQFPPSGQFDLRYVRITGSDQRVFFKSGLTIDTSFIINTTGFLNSGINISGDLILNGRKILITSVGEVYNPSTTIEVQ